jgi:hypothetical protein
MFYIVYGNKEVLGNEDRAEEMVLWSRKQETGKTVSKVLECGLTVRLVADGDEPKLYMFWDQAEFNNYCDSFGSPEVVLSHYGMYIIRKDGDTSITIQDSSEEGSAIYAFEGPGDCPVFVLGMICLLGIGPHFFTEEECQKDISDLNVEVEAFADKPVTLSDKFSKEQGPDIKGRLIAALNDLKDSNRKNG